MHNKKISLLYKNHLNIFFPTTSHTTLVHNITAAAPVESISGFYSLFK